MRKLVGADDFNYFGQFERWTAGKDAQCDGTKTSMFIRAMRKGLMYPYYMNWLQGSAFRNELVHF